MTDFMQLVSHLREQMHATLSRSDILKPFAWLVGILASAFCISLFTKPPEWVLVTLVLTLIAAVLLYGFASIFCLFHDRDALRSEKYSLQKMALEHNLIGDSTAGLFDPEETSQTAISGNSTVKQIESRS
jgi:hypothetical protein